MRLVIGSFLTRTFLIESFRLQSHKEMVKCLINPNHRIPASKASEHVQECSLRKEGYSKSDKLLSEPNYTPGSTIVIGNVG